MKKDEPFRTALKRKRSVPKADENTLPLLELGDRQANQHG